VALLFSEEVVPVPLAPPVLEGDALLLTLVEREAAEVALAGTLRLRLVAGVCRKHFFFGNILFKNKMK
jgi:hypothetical protein